MLQPRGPLGDLNWNLIGIIAAVLGGALLLWIALRLAFSVTGRLAVPPQL